MESERGQVLSVKYYKTRRDAVANADRRRFNKIYKGTWSQGLYAPESYFVIRPERRLALTRADHTARLYDKTRGMIKELRYPNTTKDEVIGSLIPREGEEWELWREEPEGLVLLYSKTPDVLRTYSL